VHDYFDILGVSRDASAQEIRRACARRALKAPPDFDGDGRSPAPLAADRRPFREFADVAVDFVDMADIADRMQAAFFRTRST